MARTLFKGLLSAPPDEGETFIIPDAHLPTMRRPKGDDAYQCFVCDAPLPGLTSTCPGCGSVYRRGELIEEHAAKPEQPKMPPSIKTRQPKQTKCPACGKRECPDVGDPYHQTFTSNQWGKTREEAIERMFDDYDKHRGRRRLPARQAFEVVQVRAMPSTKKLGERRPDDQSFWVVYVRKRRVPEGENESHLA